MSVTLVYSWECMEKGCDEKGDGPGSDRAAEKHTKTTNHATISTGRPA